MPECLIDSCFSPSHRRGWCSAHYQRYLKHGNPLMGGPRHQPRDKECAVNDCTAPVRARGMCKTHYTRAARGKPIEGPSRRTSQTELVCSVPSCERHCTARLMCDMHWRRWKKTGDPLTRPPRKKRVTARGSGPGARRVNSDGYVFVYWPEHANAHADGKVLEHTVVMAEHLGRPLVRGENVHHRNGVRDDNRLDNLELWNTSQPSGKRASDLVQYAREILDLYGSTPMMKE